MWGLHVWVQPYQTDRAPKRGGTQSKCLDTMISFLTYVGHAFVRIGLSLYQVHVLLNFICRERNRAPWGGVSQTLRSYPYRRVFIAALSCSILRVGTKKRSPSIPWNSSFSVRNRIHYIPPLLYQEVSGSRCRRTVFSMSQARTKTSLTVP